MSSRNPHGDDDAIHQNASPAEEHHIDEKKSAIDHAPGRDNDIVVHDIDILKVEDERLAPRDDLECVRDKIETLSIEECKEYTTKLLKEGEYDYNLDAALKEKLFNLLQGPSGDGEMDVEEWMLQFKTEVALYDPSIPCETIRAMLLGYIWVCVSQFVNSLFNSRYPTIKLNSAIVQVLLYPCGLFCQSVLPDWGFTLNGTRHSLNPGPWSYKEQMLATIIVDVGLTSAYCFWNIQTETVYYQDKWLTPAYCILLLLSNQLMGLSFSGLMRRFVVYPTEAIWPSMLPTLALNAALLAPEEKKQTIHGWKLTRYQFFFLFFGLSFVWYWFPGYIFTGLSFFAWMTWIAPNNFNVNALTGSNTGLGLNPIATFDWNICQYIITPLASPFWSSAQLTGGMFLSALAIIGIYYSNISWTSYLPINTPGIYDNTGQPYNITQVINSHGILVESEYEKYSPPFYTAATLVVYGAFFFYYPMTMVFVILDAWRPIARAWRTMFRSAVRVVKNIVVTTKSVASSLARGRASEAWGHITRSSSQDSIYEEFDDPFTNLLKHYPEVPDWWFLAIGAVSFAFILYIVCDYPELGTPVWTVFFVIGINLVFLIPMTYLEAISGLNVGLNVATELIIGYALPGHPEALMLIKSFGYNINGQTDNYVSDQKMGYYAKLPPRAMYRGQVFGVIFSAILCYGVVQFVDGISGICTPDQASKFNCENGSQVYYSASVVWGAIGPARIFGQIYPLLKWTFLFGFLFGLAWWVVKRTGPTIQETCRSSLPSAVFTPLNWFIFKPLGYLKNVHPSLVITGFLNWAPTNMGEIWGGLYFSFAFMWYLRRYKTAWWEKYNYVLSAALGAGVAFSGLIIFFAVQYKPEPLNWWGNVWVDNTLDAIGTSSLLPMPASGSFGPQEWH